MLAGFFILLLFYFLGEFLSLAFLIPLPGSVIGMMLLFVFLAFSARPIPAVVKSSSLLIKLMPLLFVPVCTGMMFSLDVLQENVGLLAMAIIVSTMISIVVVVLVMLIVSINYKSAFEAVRLIYVRRFSKHG